MSESGAAKVWVLAFVLAAGGGLGALIGIGCAIGANACPFADDAGTTATAGETIFAAECALCHGPGGGGSSANPRAPSLVAGASAGLSLAQLVATIERGSAGLMPRYEDKLTTEQIQAVARYVIELREGT